MSASEEEAQRRPAESEVPGTESTFSLPKEIMVKLKFH
jgi:hypothetical protein